MHKTTTQLKHLATVMVPVGDQDAAVDFYVEKLGFEKRVDIPYGENDSERWIEVAPPGAQTTLALTLPRDEWTAGRTTGVSFLADDIDATHARLRDAGVDVDAEVMRMDGPAPPMFWFRDADRNVFLIVES